MMEKNLEENDRFRAIFELAISQPSINMPELLWKAYIDAEISMNEFDKARALFERLLEKSKHLKVWISYAEFESNFGNERNKNDSLELSAKEVKFKNNHKKTPKKKREEKNFVFF